MERALVTGATGFIGRHVVRSLASRGVEIEALVRPTSDLSPFDGLNVRPVLGDILDPTTYGESVQRVDRVIHMASLLKMPWSPRFRSVHVEGTDAVARACALAPQPPSLLLVSSLAACGPTQDLVPLHEGARPAPVSVYGHAKRDAELCAITYSKDLPLTIVRPSAVFGPWDRTLLGVFRTVARGVHVVPGNGSSLMSLVDARDLAEAIVEASQRGERVNGPEGAPERGLYFISGSEHPTYGALGALVARAMDRPDPRILRLPRSVARWGAAVSESLARVRDLSTVLNRDKILEAHSGHWICQSEKAARELDWCTAQDLEVRMAQTAQWYRDQGWL
jgi:nucleoside-diphosphate-sugar epimerase